jgi:hypothetical protein
MLLNNTKRFARAGSPFISLTRSEVRKFGSLGNCELLPVLLAFAAENILTTPAASPENSRPVKQSRIPPVYHTHQNRFDMMQMCPIIGVNDVEKSSAWYQELFGLNSRHGGPKFEMLADAKDVTQLCLHKWGEHNHPTLLEPATPPGNGLILYFQTNDLESIRENARRLEAVVEAELHINPNSHLEEFSLRDPDGYYLMVSAYQS